MIDTIKVTAMALVGRPPPRRKHSAIGGVHGPYGADLAVGLRQNMDVIEVGQVGHSSSEVVGTFFYCVSVLSDTAVEVRI